MELRTMFSPRLFLLYLLFGREAQTMAVVYATLIVKKRKTLEQVPALILDDVKQILADLEVEV